MVLTKMQISKHTVSLNLLSSEDVLCSISGGEMNELDLKALWPLSWLPHGETKSRDF